MYVYVEEGFASFTAELIVLIDGYNHTVGLENSTVLWLIELIVANQYGGYGDCMCPSYVKYCS